MECLQGAFKTGFGSETTKDSLVEDFSGVLLNGVSNGGVVNGDDLFVDELFDFSNDDDVVSHGTEEQQLHEPERREQYEQEKQSVTVAKAPELSTCCDLTPKDHFGSLPESELSDPVEEGLESLEWLSNFVEDSFSEYSLAGKLPPNPIPNRSERAVNPVQQPCFTTPVQTKARTKRARSGVRVWPILSSSLVADSSSTSSSSSSNCSTTSFPFRTTEPARKVQKKKPSDVAGQPRKCSHCGVTKTPQWRAGPLGSKTLCNACGVRFKSGRLLPEYRPACSPTFSSELHSNHHRKVLEMRKKKEFETEPVGLARNF